ncbi:hypothetical protein BpHYR1_000066 [Brachionus plicatilis]|uniref:Uncharacterized protein n=1 Tax=Brachionus plicatilis TaxID=10195 RepID=A0A3M7SEZ9_BRAPC|nr:hypothetical protein BpHYR1_000066 [Brachionus plicatilis]
MEWNGTDGMVGMEMERNGNGFLWNASPFHSFSGTDHFILARTTKVIFIFMLKKKCYAQITKIAFDFSGQNRKRVARRNSQMLCEILILQAIIIKILISYNRLITSLIRPKLNSSSLIYLQIKHIIKI